jgi:hypothetical protein
MTKIISTLLISLTSVAVVGCYQARAQEKPWDCRALATVTTADDESKCHETLGSIAKGVVVNAFGVHTTGNVATEDSVEHLLQGVFGHGFAKMAAPGFYIALKSPFVKYGAAALVVAGGTIYLYEVFFPHTKSSGRPEIPQVAFIAPGNANSLAGAGSSCLLVAARCATPIDANSATDGPPDIGRQ